MSTYFKLWNDWQKHCLNGKAYKILVLLKLRKSQSFELQRIFYASTMKGWADGLK